MDRPAQEVWGDLATTAFVESSHLFRSLEADARRDVLQVARVLAFAAGEVVSGPGDDGFWLVRDGTAGVREGDRETSALERGAFFGMARVLGVAGRPETLVARTELAAVVFPTPVIAALAERSPRMKKLLEAVLAAREKEAGQRPPT